MNSVGGVESIFSIFGIPDPPISHGLFPYKEHIKQPQLRRHVAKTPQDIVLLVIVYNFLEEQFLRAANISRTNALQTKPKTSNDVVPFVVTYNPALPRISNILRKHFNILHSSNRCKDVFKQPPFVAYRRSPNLRDILVKAQLPVISNNHFPPGSFRCGQNCATCPYITNGLTRYTFYATGETRSITSHITCNT